MVVAAVIQHKSPLAIGNVVGSSISNVLGAFSLGLLFNSSAQGFDRSAKIYTALLLLLTTVFVLLAYFRQLSKTAGGILIAVFALYVSSIAFAIYRGVLDAPEGSDDGSESETSDDETYGESDTHRPQLSESSPLLSDDASPESVARPRGGPRSLTYHIAQLILGFLALVISGYVLSHTASSIAEAANISSTVLGITILSFATTLPEKFVAVLGGMRGHAGILVANTAGSNIFLLTLCLGVVLVAGELDPSVSSVTVFELAVTWVSAATLFLVVLLGLGRWTGVLMVILYVAFLVLEFTVYKR